MEPRPEFEPTLKRELGLLEATLCGVGIILGAGIYALVGKAAGMAGNGVWISFLIAAVVAAFSGLSYAELSSVFPKAGAEYVYTKNAFGRRLAFIVGWMVIFSGIIAAPAVALGFAGYLNALIDAPIIVSAIAIIILLSFVMFIGVKESAWLAMVGTIFEAGGLILIIFIGIPYLGSVDYFELPEFNGILAASALIFFAFIGFEEMTRLSEETKNPEKTMPKALIIAIAVSAVLYVLVAISAISVLGWEKLGASEAPLAEVAAVGFGSDAFVLLSIIALFATGNTVLLVMMAASRITFGMGRDKTLPSILGKIHKGKRTPWIAIAVVGIISAMFVLLGEIEVVASITNYTVFVTFMAVNAALIWLRYKKPDMERPFKTPINIGWFPVLPVFGFLTSLAMLFYIGTEALIYGTSLLILGVIAYEVLERFKHK